MENLTLTKLTKAKEKIRVVPDFPKKGISFKDISPLLEESKTYRFLINTICSLVKGKNIDKVVGIDARGFLLAAPVAYKLKSGLVMVRKKGKLPHKTIGAKYKLEYGFNELQIHAGSIKKGESVIIIDDVLATGGTAKATSSLVNQAGGKIINLIFLIELRGLKGREKLKGLKIKSLIKYQ